MSLYDLANRTTFLGVEFVTWLWFRSETQDGLFADLPGAGKNFELYFDDRLLVSALAVDCQENLYRGGLPATSIEAKAALRAGKKAVEARIRIVRDEGEWSFLLKGPALAVSGVKVPAVLAPEDEECILERMTLIEDLDRMLRSLYRRFLELRLGASWERSELPALRQWIATEG
ncbi:MAG: hypothetical protein HYV63_17255 [Candidatus Schekmanbacteria bacterium]|nr:hypothetical protein [Candidatus Schekmanbacteria bacterium]